MVDLRNRNIPQEGDPKGKIEKDLSDFPVEKESPEGSRLNETVIPNRKNNEDVLEVPQVDTEIENKPSPAEILKSSGNGVETSIGSDQETTLHSNIITGNMDVDLDNLAAHVDQVNKFGASGSSASEETK